MGYFIFTGLIFICGMYRAIIKKDRLGMVLLGSLGIILLFFLLWASTFPQRRKMENVYYKNEKHRVTKSTSKDRVITLTLDNGVNVNIDSVTSAEPRNALSWVTDLREKYKF